jgi:CheY-like chemotaxis protein
LTFHLADVSNRYYGTDKRDAVWLRCEGIRVVKILVADDNTNIQRTVALAFEKRGIQVISVGNGEAAVRRLADSMPDLVLADIFMPVRSGYEVCEYVKKDERFLHIPVILLAGAFDPFDEKEARRVGADGVLKKPFVPPDPLIAMVISILEKNPKVAAELAMATRAAAEPPQPRAAQAPVHASPKALGEFPEPSPKEAAQIYGFGSGKRAPDDTSNQPLAPIAPADEEAEQGFDGAATTRDWRRTAMDFEVSEEAAQRPAFSSDENLEPITFPSEGELLARHVSSPAQETEPVLWVHPTPEPEAISSQVAAAPSIESAPEVSEAEPGFREAPAVASEAMPEPSFASRATEWMDSIAPSPPEYPGGGWFAAATSAAAEAEAGRTADAPLVLAVPEQSQIPGPELHAEAGVEAPEAATSVSVSHLENEEPFFPDETDAGARRTVEPFDEPAPESVAGASADFSDELLVAPADATRLQKDPELVEPTAVRLAREPLLVDDEPRGPSGYGPVPQSISPLYVFQSPLPASSTLEEPVAPEVAAHSESETEAFESPFAEVDERIPTGPPPNREALSEIPFLTPPADFLSGAENGGAMNAETVDAVVRKVLEKIDSQLRELLSEDVLRPLVENLLQDELEKKMKG